MGDDKPDAEAVLPRYFYELAEKLRAAGEDVCRTCDIDLPPDAKPPIDPCGPRDCSAKRIFRAAEDIERDIDGEDGSAA